MKTSRAVRQQATPSFWDLARQTAFGSADRHRSYEALKRQWQAENKGASSFEHEQAMARIAHLCGV